MKVLFLSSWYPYPPSNGSKLRIYNLLRGLASQHSVTLLTFADQQTAERAPNELSAICQRVEAIPAKTFQPHNWRSRLSLLNPLPRSVVETFSPIMAKRITATLDQEAPDLIIASQGTANYQPWFRKTPAIFEEVELAMYYEPYMRAASPKSRLRHGLTWIKHRRYMHGLVRRFGACTVASEQERHLLDHVAPTYDSIHVIPNCVLVADYAVANTAQPQTLIFTGSFRYQPNYEAMVWFLGEVYGRIQEALPAVQLTITGDHGNLPLPPASNVTLTGLVDDIRTRIAQSWISIVPLLSGGGTRLKILEAMALRTPVVTTTKGAEGLGVQHEEHLLIADTPEAFAAAVIRLQQDPALRTRLAANAYAKVSHEYDWSIVMPRFLALVDQVANA